MASHGQKIPVRMKQQVPILDAEGCNQHVNRLANDYTGGTQTARTTGARKGIGAADHRPEEECFRRCLRNAECPVVAKALYDFGSPMAAAWLPRVLSRKAFSHVSVPLKQSIRIGDRQRSSVPPHVFERATQRAYPSLCSDLCQQTQAVLDSCLLGLELARLHDLRHSGVINVDAGAHLHPIFRLISIVHVEEIPARAVPAHHLHSALSGLAGSKTPVRHARAVFDVHGADVGLRA